MEGKQSLGPFCPSVLPCTPSQEPACNAESRVLGRTPNMLGGGPQNTVALCHVDPRLCPFSHSEISAQSGTLTGHKGASSLGFGTLRLEAPCMTGCSSLAVASGPRRGRQLHQGNGGTGPTSTLFKEGS